jgi:reductive dehalogenase
LLVIALKNYFGESLTMVLFLLVLQAVFVAVIVLFTICFLVASLNEKEQRAALIAAAVIMLLIGLELCIYWLYTLGFFFNSAALPVLSAGWAVIGYGIFIFGRHTGPNEKALKGVEGLIVGKAQRFDEREQVFARERSIRPGSAQYEDFYRRHPELEKSDSERRAAGGILGTPGAIDRPGELPNISAMEAAFAIPPHFGKPKNHSPAVQLSEADRPAISPEEAARRVKGFARQLGVGSVGITRINPLWVYSHRGEIFYENWEKWGREITVDHAYAIVLAVEMDWEMVSTAPHTPSVAESALSYSKGSWISTQLAAFIANLGYAATANHSRHYDLLLTPAAVDAGLGELGRFGYLITRELGPRVRIFAVTTDLPMVCDQPVDIGVEDFCRICKKCAHCCPSVSIPDGDQQEVNGSLRWKLNAETCFGYWAKAGTDCNICMRVCPWSHPRSFPHRVVISQVVRNKWARRLFLLMDDLFYGKKPKPKTPPTWAQYS